MKVLVTGAAGLIGSELVSQLNKLHDVVGVDNFSRTSMKIENTSIINLDLTQPILTLDTDFDYIFHYAAINGTTNFYNDPNRVLKTNVLIDLNVFDFAKKNKNLKNFIYASSSEIVSGETPPIPELVDISISDIHNSRWSYRIGKLLAENYLINCKDFNKTIFRYFNVYGYRSQPGHFVYDQIHKLLAGNYEIIGFNETRSFCNVKDAANASIFCAQLNLNNGIINIGNDEEITIEKATYILADHLHINNKEWKLLAGNKGSTKRRRPDISKLRVLMPNYHPVSFTVGVQNICESYSPRTGT